jgi:hypothetical protein
MRQISVYTIEELSENAQHRAIAEALTNQVIKTDRLIKAIAEALTNRVIETDRLIKDDHAKLADFQNTSSSLKWLLKNKGLMFSPLFYAVRDEDCEFFEDGTLYQ